MGRTSRIPLGLECHVWHMRNGINVNKLQWTLINCNGINFVHIKKLARKKRSTSRVSNAYNTENLDLF